MGRQIPRDLEIVTALEFVDGENKYLQSWRGQLIFTEGEIINFRGDLGVSECRPGRYIIHSDDPASQLSLKPEGDVLYKFYRASRLKA